MGTYPVNKIRNVCLLGHGGDGKTSLIESILYQTGITDRLGKIPDGNTVCDFDVEEIKRKISISLAVAPVEFLNCKLNVVDTPGYFDFLGEVSSTLRVCDSGIIVVTAKSGPGVGTEKAFKALKSKNKPTMFYISKIDEDNADYYLTLHKLQKQFGVSVCPVVVPIIEDDKESGVVDVVIRKAYKMDGNKRVEVPMPENMIEKVSQHRAHLCENVAELSEELMERYFAGEEFSDDELISGIAQGVKSALICPVFCGSSFTGIGTYALLKGICDFMPSPDEAPIEIGEDEKGDPTEIAVNPNGSVCAVVFKTTNDQYGKVSYFKVVSGNIKNDTVLHNMRTGTSEKIGKVFFVRGKKAIDVSEISCGDIGAVSKLLDTKTGDTLSAVVRKVNLEPIEYPKPCYNQTLTPKVKGNEEKISTGLQKIAEEDKTFTYYMNSETKEHVISGQGDIHLDVICSKLKNKFGVEVNLSSPKVAYRERIRKKVSVEGKHKKQSGGHGQYGHVKMEFEPHFQGDFLFEERIFGGSVPKNYHPAVEKGIREAMEHGILAGYPLVGLKAILFDGSYHDVDSNELSFKMAAKLAYRAGITQADSVILEPISHMEITVDEQYMGDVIGDINRRRGRIISMSRTDDGHQLIIAETPTAEISDYAITLRSMTQGRAGFVSSFIRYEDAPLNIQEQVIANSPYKQQEA